MADAFFANLPVSIAARLRAGTVQDEIALPGWGARFRIMDANGWLPIDFSPDGSEVEELLPGHIAALERFIADEVATAQAIEHALANALPELRRIYGDDSGKLPVADDIGATCTPINLFFHDLNEAGILIGVELNCDWDEEHGLGLLLRDGKALGVGSADTAFSRWIAREAAQGTHQFSFWKA